MKKSLFNLFLSLTVLEGLAALAVYLSIPSEKQTALPFHLSASRLALGGLLFLVLLGCLVLWLARLKNPNLWQKGIGRFEEKLDRGQDLLFAVSALCVTAFVFSIEAFFLTYVIFPPFARPIFLWVAAFFLQARVLLQVRFPDRYEPITKILRRKWLAWQPVQRKTFWVLLLLLVVYFCAFIPANSVGWEGPAKSFYSGIDEVNQYPVVVATLRGGDTFESTVYNLFANESEIYGHQYVTLEALVLLPSRILLGKDFGTHVQLNLFLLRQFMCVSFSALSILIMVYLITRFKNLLVSAGLFVFMLTIPGIVHFNTRFLHPDAVVLFFIVLTFYYLQKDDLQFRRAFFFAAITCSLSIGIKLWGVFFAFPVLLYLILGLAKKRLNLKRFVLLGMGFVGVMAVTIVVTNPGLLIPAVFKNWTSGLAGSISNRAVGYADPTNSGIYTKDFPTWMNAIKENYLQEYYFFFCYAALAFYAFLGKQKRLAQLLLAWCVPLALFLIYFIAPKSYWWMMELLIPLYPAPFFLLALTSETDHPLVQKLTVKKWVIDAIWAVTLALCGTQFVINILKLLP